ncbi:Uncharacterised protein [Chlamydia trachomatis]|nr:Uncharacterised protein [Chlamydia trachomatis]
MNTLTTTVSVSVSVPVLIFTKSPLNIGNPNLIKSALLMNTNNSLSSFFQFRGKSSILNFCGNGPTLNLLEFSGFVYWSNLSNCKLDDK